jgi:uncharacterized protein
MQKIVTAALLTLAAVIASAANYRQSIESWRKDRETRLKAPDSWLSLAGLFWLHEGDNTVGSDAASDIALPAGRVPAQIGKFVFRSGRTRFQIAAGAEATLNGRPVRDALLKSDADGSPDVLRCADLSMTVIQRGTRFGIRLRDPRARTRTEFKGLHWYPVDERYRVVAKWTAYDPPRSLSVPSVLGYSEVQPAPGFAEFELDGHKYRLDPMLEAGALFFVFRDRTALGSTYGAGRFLDAELPKDGRVVLDFNKSYNPPCAFTPYATCPLPPKQNRLTVAIEAGELRYGNH